MQESFLLDPDFDFKNQVVLNFDLESAESGRDL
jgi:hypothetical protein